MRHQIPGRELGLVLGFATVVTAPVAPAQQLIDATDPARVFAVAQGHGDAALAADGMGDPQITVAHSGHDYLVYFYD